MNKTEQHSKTWKRFTNVILVFEQNSHSGKRICEDKRSAHGIFCEDNSHSLKFDVDLASHEGQWLPHRDASVQHKSKETRLGEGQERNQEEGGGLERGKGGGGRRGVQRPFGLLSENSSALVPWPVPQVQLWYFFNWVFSRQESECDIFGNWAFSQARSMEYSTSKETQENINKTFQELELTAKVIASL